jgi:hypothetical protein
MITNHIPKYVSKGLKDKLWYENQTAEFIKIFGYIRLPLVSKIFAATSINSSLKSNIRLFRKAYHEMTNNLPLSNYLPVMKLQLERIQKGEDINGRKIKSFAAALSGDPNAVVVDIWLLRAFEVRSTIILKCTSMRDTTTVLQERISFEMAKELQKRIEDMEHTKSINDFIHGKKK